MSCGSAIDQTASGRRSGVTGSCRIELVVLRRDRLQIPAQKIEATINLTASRPALSPDGRKIAFNVLSANDDIWIYDINSGVSNRFSFDAGNELSAVWTPDGTRIIYSATGRLMVKRADGAGEAEELVRSTYPYVTACSPDGNLVAYTDVNPQTGYDLWTVPLKGDRTPRVQLRSPADEWGAGFSPDGKWIVYVANDTPSQPPEVYVRAATSVGGRWQISADGVEGLPKWSADGKEVFYREGDTMLAVPVSIRGGEVRPGKPQRLFSVPEMWNGRLLSFDIDKGGFLIAHRIHPPVPQQIDVVLNWTQQLGR